MTPLECIAAVANDYADEDTAKGLRTVIEVLQQTSRRQPELQLDLESYPHVVATLATLLVRSTNERIVGERAIAMLSRMVNVQAIELTLRRLPPRKR
jgi:hypothetical protein